MWSVGSILTGLYSFMLLRQPTQGSMETSKQQKVLITDTSTCCRQRHSHRVAVPVAAVLSSEPGIQQQRTNISEIVPGFGRNSQVGDGCISVVFSADSVCVCEQETGGRNNEQNDSDNSNSNDNN